MRCESGVSAADMCIMSALHIATIVDSTFATCTWTSMCVRERLRINIGVAICRLRWDGLGWRSAGCDGQQRWWTSVQPNLVDEPNRFDCAELHSESGKTKSEDDADYKEKYFSDVKFRAPGIVAKSQVFAVRGGDDHVQRLRDVVCLRGSWEEQRRCCGWCGCWC